MVLELSLELTVGNIYITHTLPHPFLPVLAMSGFVGL
jgi:xanthosine utilization system XapX-like protein